MLSLRRLRYSLTFTLNLLPQIHANVEGHQVIDRIKKGLPLLEQTPLQSPFWSRPCEKA